MIRLKVEFLGGLDVIFDKQRHHELTLSDNVVTMGHLITYITDKMISNKNDIPVFIENNNIKPGILVLINDTDWELEGEKEYRLEEDDVISFTSTLHGG